MKPTTGGIATAGDIQLLFHAVGNGPSSQVKEMAKVEMCDQRLSRKAASDHAWGSTTEDTPTQFSRHA